MAKHWLIGALLSAALHGGVAAVILVSLPPAAAGVHGEPQPVIMVDLFRPGDEAAGDVSGAISNTERPSPPSDIAEASAAISSKPAVTSGPSSSTAPGASAGASLNSAALSDYYRRLESHLARFHTYPSLGGRRPEGLTRIGLIVNRRGQILDAWIETSSGSRDLDDAALQTVRRSEPLPSLPGDLPASIDLIVPLNFDSGMRAAS